MKYDAGRIDVAVIGAGHAGIEAGLASARLGCKTEVFTVNLDWVGNMPCNPSIGGTSKGHLVREIDALGGEMGLAADANTLQMRMLNLGKGPAVHSPRAQIDRRAYSAYMKRTLEEQENLTLRQAEIVDIHYDSGEWVLTTRLEAVYRRSAWCSRRALSSAAESTSAMSHTRADRTGCSRRPSCRSRSKPSDSLCADSRRARPHESTAEALRPKSSNRSSAMRI